MSIIQISKIQQRSGNLVDLPQLSEAEFGWASDAKKLYIGKTTPNENIEVLTSYSQINYSQINGTVGNLNISNVTVGNGQVLAYDGSNWVNRGGDAGGLINLGNVSNVKISGGAIGYVLETDGLGNLAWTPKSSVVAYIQNVTKANPAVVTTTQSNFFTDRTQITITDAVGMTDLNGKSYYVDVLTSNTFALYANADLTGPINSTTYNAYSYTTVASTVASTSIITVGNTAPFTENQEIQFIGDLGNSALENNTAYYIKDILGATTLTVSEELLANGVAGNTKAVATASFTGVNMYGTGGRAIAAVGTSSGGKAAEGSDTTIQFNKNNLLSGDADFTWTYDGAKVLTVVGNANVSNLNSTGLVSASRYISNIATGTAPLSVVSTTRVGNLNVAYANVSDFVNVTAPGTGTGYLVFANGTTGNVAEYTSAGISANLANNSITATTFVGTLSGAATTAGTVTTAAQPNITSVGRLSNLTVGNSTANTVFGNGTIAITEAAGAAWVVSGKTSGLTNDSGLYIDAVNNFQFAARDGANSLRVLFDANSSSSSYINAGNVGIGTTSPVDKLDVDGNAYVGADTNNALFIGSNASYARIGALGRSSFSNSGLQLFTSTASATVTAVTIDPNGNVGIGNLSPAHNLSVTGTMNVTGNTLLATSSGRVGVGTTTPYSPFTVRGESTQILLDINSATDNTYSSLAWNGSNVDITVNPTAEIRGYRTSSGALGALAFHTRGSLATSLERMRIDSAGNVGIANSAPTHTLSVTGTTNISGNANVGNLGTAQVLASANVTAPQFISNVVNGTAPLVVSSSTRVANLNVAYANVADYINVTTQSSGNSYLILSNALSGNVTETTNAAFVVNTSNGALYATTFVGTLSGNATRAGTVTTAAQPNITSVGVLSELVVSGNLTTTDITTGLSTNGGNITGNWVLTAGSKLQATYADLAEYYEADDIYAPGTVLMFGGDKEVTIAEDGTNRVAGVVSTNPAYVMNATCPGLLTAVALQGRVPCKVRGKIVKGDMMVSGGNGYARPEKFPTIGTVIGKALQDFDGYEGVIEVAVGRL